MIEFDVQFWTALLQIIGVNIILSGDNAIVIALACRGLPPKQQKWGVFLGAGAAVVLRILFTAFIAYLLTVEYLKIAGGALLFWIGYKLMIPQQGGDEVDAGGNLWQAVRIVLIADAVMSLDNVIAVAAAAKGDYVLLILGLAISVPLVVYGATLLIQLLNRFPVIVPGGAALIGYIGGEVIVTDPVWHAWIVSHVRWMHEALPLLGAVLVVLVGRVVAPPPPLQRPSASDGAIGASALFGGRLGLQVLGGMVAARAPTIIAFIAGASGYTIAGVEDAAGDDASFSILHGLRPLFAAAVAIVIGELAGRLACRRRGAPVPERPSS